MKERSYYLTTSREELMKPQQGDYHPMSGYGRVVLRLVLLEVDRLCDQFQLEVCDDVDAERYERALVGFYVLAHRQWSPQSPSPCGEQLRQIRSGIREFERWRRKPTEEELRQIVDKACGIERQEVSGADAAARRVVSAPRLPELPPAPRGDTLPSWLPSLVDAVGDNDLALQTFMMPLLNMSENGAYRAIENIRKGVESGKERRERMVEEARRVRRSERQSFVGRCHAEAKRLLRERREMARGGS